MSDVQSQSEIHWTAKLPLLVLAAILSIWGTVAICYYHSRVGTLTGIALILAAVLFFGYSLEIKNWCDDPLNNAFSSEFSQNFLVCLRIKGWLEW